jgi:hypothetical protein
MKNLYDLLKFCLQDDEKLKDIKYEVINEMLMDSPLHIVLKRIKKYYI